MIEINAAACFAPQDVIADRLLRLGFLTDIDNRKPVVIHPGFALPSANPVHVISDTMEFLGAYHEIDMRNIPHQFRSPALRHAAEEAEHDSPACSGGVAKHSHFANRLLLSHVAHAARIQQHHVGISLVIGVNSYPRETSICATCSESRLVHLASVSFDEDFGH